MIGERASGPGGAATAGPMRIVLAVPGGVHPSGRERVIPALLWLIARLASRHEVHVISLHPASRQAEYQLLGATVHEVAARPVATLLPRYLRIAGSLAPFDVVHAFWAGYGAALAALAARWRRAPLVVSLGGGELVSFPDISYGGGLRWRARVAVRLALSFADAVTAASEPMAHLARPLRRDVRLIPLGVDCAVFTPPATPPPGPAWRLLHVGSINGVKDQATLLRALRLVLDRGAEARLDLVGGDTLGGALARMVADLGLRDHVTLHGFRPTDEVAPLYRAAHVYVLSSRHEAGPVAAIEAAACGVPTVGTAVGHVAEWAPALATAVPVGQAGALADAILALLADPVRRRQMGEAARAWALRHDADWTAAAFETVYRELQARG